MNGSFFKFTSISIFIFVVIIIFGFSSTITTLSYSNDVTVSNGNIVLPDDIYFSMSKFLWPTPRTYYYNFTIWV